MYVEVNGIDLIPSFTWIALSTHKFRFQAKSIINKVTSNQPSSVMIFSL